MFIIRFCFVYSFIIVSQIVATCPYIRTSVILADCVFDTSLYISLGAHIFNSNSIDFIGHYSFNNNNHTENHITNTLIYNLGNRWMLLLPLLLKCSHQPVNLTFTECQYTMRQHKHTSRSSSIAEYMTTQLSVINVTNLGMQSVLFLQPGEITLRSCKAYDCSKQLVYLTASNETFNFKIDFEKSIGTKCYSNADCSNRYSTNDLIYCDQISQTCQCFNENITRIDIPNIGRVCTDAIDRSNCSKFPQRCLQWCDESKTSHCICPPHTRKVRKINGVFDCELEPTGKCRFDDEDTIGATIRKCPTGTICDDNQCRPLTIFRKKYDIVRNETVISTTASMINLFSSPKNETIPLTTSFVSILIIITIVTLLCFILIIFIIAMLIKTHRCRLSSSSEDKVSSSSFAQSTSTAISTDFSNEIYQFQQLPIISTDYSRRYENYLITRPTFLHGIVPQSNLSPRFHRQYQGLERIQRRAPLQIKSPSLSCNNKYTDHGLLTTNKYDNNNNNNNNNTKRRNHLPTVTHLQNGDVLISA
ncbi:unnamed protein product [Rotaria socialis]|uniref:Uncharacterized protein n=1 Tax=Rotaria socialis TaxID=392032 RepID=A0A818D8J6_9BILA|nr:unnamed protein product [Rotaria socialis]CAF3440713.1 unnamed protein product [Rotaria socialis]CAF4142037.1 unnamed protein product [Rotaria socialis]CAF4307720.1 unnamed protein product [Rotaria socialis]